jgi:Mg/Co/Ni transporter MgtE
VGVWANGLTTTRGRKMIQAIEMSREDMHKILEALPKDLRKKIMEQIKPDSGISIVEQFVEQYEDDNMMDHILAHTVSNLIRKITEVAKGVSKDRKKEGKRRLSAIELSMIVIECLKDEAKIIQNALDHREKECGKGDDCGAKE